MTPVGIVMSTYLDHSRLVMRFGVCMLIILLGSSSVAAQPGGLVLWNKLGSDSEVTNSEWGENGVILGGAYAYEPAQHGNGYVRKNTGNNFIQFPGSVIHGLSSRGAIELWINPKVEKPAPYQYGFFALIGSPVSGPTVPVNRGNVYLYWGDTVTGTGLYGGVRFDSSLAQTPSEQTQFVATIGVPFHAAICWDIDGIDGTSDKVRVYRDGVDVGSTTASWNPNGTTLEENFNLGLGPDGQGFDKFISDNIKVWNFAKTDFSDRFYDFVDDGDGVFYLEESGPDGNDFNYDGNNDAIPDNIQGSVASFHAEAGEHYVTLVEDDGFQLENVAAVPNPSPGYAPDGIDFPYGFFEFRITGLTAGQSTTLILILPEAAYVKTYWKYGPTPGTPNAHWYEFMFDDISGASITGYNVVSMVFTDGRRGDDDLTADGVIIDQGGPGAPHSHPVPTLSAWGVILWSTILIAVVCLTIRRKKPLLRGA